MQDGGGAGQKHHRPAGRADIGARRLPQYGPRHPAEGRARHAQHAQPDRQCNDDDEAPDHSEIDPVQPEIVDQQFGGGRDSPPTRGIARRAHIEVRDVVLDEGLAREAGAREGVVRHGLQAGQGGSTHPIEEAGIVARRDLFEPHGKQRLGEYDEGAEEQQGRTGDDHEAGGIQPASAAARQEEHVGQHEQQHQQQRRPRHRKQAERDQADIDRQLPAPRAHHHPDEREQRVAEGHAGGLGREELGPNSTIEQHVAQVVLVYSLAIEDVANRIAHRPQAGIGLEQAADQDRQGEAQEQSGDLLAGRLRHRQEQRVADRDRVGELDQSIGPPRQERDVRRTEDGDQIEQQDADQTGQMTRSNQIPSPPKKKYSGNAGRQGREWHLFSDLDGVVGVEAEQEQPYQGTVQPIETSRGVR